MKQLQLKPERVWSVPQIAFASGLAGFLGGGLLVGKNYKTFGEPKKAKRSVWIGVIATVLLVLFVSFLPDSFVNRLPRFTFAFVQFVVMHEYARRYQKVRIDETLERGGKRYSYWRWLLIVVGFVILSFLLILGVVEIFNIIFR